MTDAGEIANALAELDGSDFEAVRKHSETLRCAIATLTAERDALREEAAKLTAEMERRDKNETRNCVNWGPCSRRDAKMIDSDCVDSALLEKQP